MQKLFNQYYLTELLSDKLVCSTYLAYPARDEKRRVVVKIFDHASLLPVKKQDRSQIVAMHSLNYPHIVSIVDIAVERGSPFVVNRYMPDHSLRWRLDQIAPEKLRLSEALRVITQVALALDYAHTRHLFHGNVKPQNIFYDSDGDVLLSDFILTSLLDLSVLDYSSDMQTAAYMAPEVFTGKPTALSDQYSLGCLAYELLVGHVPFSASHRSGMWSKHSSERPVTPKTLDAKIPESLEKVVLRAMAKEPMQRYPSMSDFLQAFQGSFPFPLPSIAHPVTGTAPLPHDRLDTLNRSPHAGFAPARENDLPDLSSLELQENTSDSGFLLRIPTRSEQAEEDVSEQIEKQEEAPRQFQKYHPVMQTDASADVRSESSSQLANSAQQNDTWQPVASSAAFAETESVVEEDMPEDDIVPMPIAGGFSLDSASTFVMSPVNDEIDQQKTEDLYQDEVEEFRLGVVSGVATVPLDPLVHALSSGLQDAVQVPQIGQVGYNKPSSGLAGRSSLRQAQQQRLISVPALWIASISICVVLVFLLFPRIFALSSNPGVNHQALVVQKTPSNVSPTTSNIPQIILTATSMTPTPTAQPTIQPTPSVLPVASPVISSSATARSIQPTPVPAGATATTSVTPTVVIPTPTVAPAPKVTLTGGYTMQTSDVYNLTAQGTLDWMSWGLRHASEIDQMADGSSLIQTYTVIGNASVQRDTRWSNYYIWSNGTPVTANFSGPSGVYVKGVGDGFSLTVAASTTPRTLRVYVGAYRSWGTITASLPGATSYTNSVLNELDGNEDNAIYTFTFSSTLPNQALTITYTSLQDNSGYVILQAATLQ